MTLTTILPRGRSATEKLLSRREFSPASPDFDAERLRAATGPINGKSERDLKLIEFAVFTGRAIASLDEGRMKHPVHELAPMIRLQVLLAVVDHELRSIRRDDEKQVAAITEGNRRHGRSTRRMRGGLKLRSAEALESVIDGFAYVVADAICETRDGADGVETWRDLDTLGASDIIEYVNFGTSYRTLFERWQRVLLLGADVHRQYALWTIRATPSSAKRAAVAEARKYRQAHWEQKLALQRPEIAARPIGRVSGVLMPTLVTHDFRFDDEVWRFGSSPRAARHEDDARFEAAQVAAAMYAWINEMVEENIDDDGVNCRELLEAWLVIREVAQSFVEEAPANEEVPHSLLVLDAADLRAHLALALNCGMAKASAYVDHLLHDGTLSSELYGHPLIQIAAGRIAVFTHGPINADLERVLNRWLKRHLGGPTVDVEKAYARKGSIFETFIRNTFKEAIAHAELPGWNMESDGVRFEGKAKREGREFDLLVSFGSTLIVGEIKCSAHPDDPAEVADREIMIEKAVVQVKEQVRWLRANWSEFKERVSLPLARSADEHRIVPVVLVDGCYGPGFPIDGVPVIDGAELKNFILSGKLTVGQAEFTDEPLRMYSDAASAEAVLPAFLEQPPLISRYISECRPRRLKYAATSDGKDRFIYEDWIPGPETPVKRVPDLVRSIGEDLASRSEMVGPMMDTRS